MSFRNLTTAPAIKSLKWFFVAAIIVVPIYLSSRAPNDDISTTVEINQIFSDHMVLQRDKKVKIWGTGAPGREVVVKFAGQMKKTRGNQKGQWQIELDPLKMCREGRELLVNNTVIQDVVVGDIWLASGQSNMLSDIGLKPALPLLRVLRRQWYPSQLDVFSGRWETFTNHLPLSDVAYGFAQEIIKSQQIPIGIIVTAEGGTLISMWIPPDEKDAPKGLYGKLLSDPKADPNEQEALDASEVRLWRDRQKLEQVTSDIDSVDQKIKQGTFRPDCDSVRHDARNARPFRAVLFLRELASWGEKRVAAKASGEDLLSDRPTLVRSYSLYSKYIAPYEGLAIKGFLWYQGESDGPRGYWYRQSNQLLIDSWRKRFATEHEELPWIQAEICPVQGLHEGIAYLREAQRLTARTVPLVGISINNDRGPGPWTNDSDLSNIHPKGKEEIGRRLGLWARANVYGEKELAFYGPWMRTVSFHGNKAVVYWDHAHGGLATRDGGPLTYFKAAGQDRVFHPAKAIIVGDTVEVTCEQVKEITAIRFAFEEYAPSNLMNKEGLPAAAFRTDDWPDPLDGRDIMEPYWYLW